MVFVNSKMGTLLLADAINKVAIELGEENNSICTTIYNVVHEHPFLFQSCNHLSAVGIHGDMAQERRSAILHGFLEGKYHIVVGTGVLARGLDLVNVQQV